MNNGLEFENIIKAILRDIGWNVIDSNGRPVDVLAKLAGFTLLIECKDYPKSTLAVQNDQLFVWRERRLVPVPLRGLTNAIAKTNPDKYIVVTSGKIENKYKDKYGKCEVITYPYFKQWIHAFTNRVLNSVTM